MKHLLAVNLALASALLGATAFGFTCIWVNRAGLPEEYPELAPVAVVRDLASLATLEL